MKKIAFAVLAGAVFGALVSTAATSAKPGGGGGGTACGPNGLVCTGKQECCMSPAPFTFRCVAPGTCSTNN